MNWIIYGKAFKDVWRIERKRKEPGNWKAEKGQNMEKRKQKPSATS